MKEIYISSDALRTLSQISRYLIIKHNTIYKMSNPNVLSEICKFCKNCNDAKVEKLYAQLLGELAEPLEEDGTCFVFAVDQEASTLISNGSVGQADNFPDLDQIVSERRAKYR